MGVFGPRVRGGIVQVFALTSIQSYNHRNSIILIEYIVLVALKRMGHLFFLVERPDSTVRSAKGRRLALLAGMLGEGSSGME